MFRKTLTILSLLGLLLSVGAWGASYLQWGLTVHRYWLHTVPVVLILHRDNPVRSVQEIEASFSWLGWPNFHVGGRCYLFASKLRVPTQWDFLPGWYRNTAGAGIVVPLWMPTVVFGLALSLCRPYKHHRRNKRKRLGLCVNCGYDLRGSEERCPECGQGFPKSTATAS